MFGQGLNFGGLTGAAAFDADFLVVAGGGGGGAYNGGGGGGGGLRTSYGSTSGGGSSTETALSLSVNTPVTVIVGAGGSGQVSSAQSVNGSSSTFSSIVSTGGGAGGGYTGSFYNGSTGGSGGGGAYASNIVGPGAGTTNQGFAGGNGDGGTNSGGGGGAGAVGQNGSSTKGGNGGSGVTLSITGSNVGYAGGGAGAGYPAGGGSGGTGSDGGGNGGANSAGTDGVINTGGGGGGSQDTASPPNNAGGSGGSGTVILRYPTASVSSFAVTGTLDTTANTAYPIANKAYYKLNGNANDSSGNGYNGTASNVTYAAGRFGQTGVFNGSNSKIEISGLNSFLASSSSKSWSCWVKTTSTGNIGNRAIISDYGNGVGNYNFDCFLTPVNGKVLLYSKAGGSSVGMTSLVTINDGVWHHICAVQDTATTNLKLYIDSNLQGSITIGTGTRLSSLFIGTYGAGYYWDGEIDQVRIFSSALSAGNVTSLYNESTVVESIDGTDSILQFIGGSGDITFS